MVNIFGQQKAPKPPHNATWSMQLDLLEKKKTE